MEVLNTKLWKPGAWRSLKEPEENRVSHREIDRQRAREGEKGGSAHQSQQHPCRCAGWDDGLWSWLLPDLWWWWWWCRRWSCWWAEMRTCCARTSASLPAAVAPLPPLRVEEEEEVVEEVVVVVEEVPWMARVIQRSASSPPQPPPSSSSPSSPCPSPSEQEDVSAAKRRMKRDEVSECQQLLMTMCELDCGLPMCLLLAVFTYIVINRLYIYVVMLLLVKHPLLISWSLGQSMLRINNNLINATETCWFDYRFF